VFAKYDDEKMEKYEGIHRIHVVEVLTYPFDSELAFSKISILSGANLDMPGNGYHMHLELAD